MRRLLPLLLIVACSRESATPPAAPSSTASPASASTTAPPTATGTTAPATTTAPPATTTAPAPAAKPADPVEHGAFVVTREGKTLYREQFARNSRRIESDIAASGGNERVLQVVNVNPDGTILNVAVKMIGGNYSVEQMAIEIKGDKADVHILDKKGVSASKTMDIPRGTLPNPIPESLTVLEQVIRRAKKIGGKMVEVPLLPGTLQPQRVFVTFTSPTTARVQTASANLDAKIDAEGRLLSASEAAQKIEIRRE